MMRRWGAIGVLAAGSVFLPACFDFRAPIDPAPTRTLDSALVGTWRCLGMDEAPDAKPANFVITATSERIYSIRFEAAGEDSELYEGYASDVKGHTLLNVRDLAPTFPAKPWTFVRYSFLLPDVLRVQLVDAERLEGIEQTSASLRPALERLDGTPGLYVDFCICVRTALESKSSAVQQPGAPDKVRR